MSLLFATVEKCGYSEFLVTNCVKKFLIVYLFFDLNNNVSHSYTSNASEKSFASIIGAKTQYFSLL